MNLLKSLFVALTCLVLTGCAVSLPEYEPVESRRATITLRGLGQELRAIGIFERDQNDRVRLVIRSNNEIILTLVSVPGGWVAVGPLAGGRGWQGHPDEAPVEVAGWIVLAEAYEASAHVKANNSEYRNGRLSANFRFEEIHLASMDVVAVATEDRYAVRF
ncbi:MAG: hypothetical protein WA771_14015 [Chthoniobacterales bacterium]